MQTVTITNELPTSTSDRVLAHYNRQGFTGRQFEGVGPRGGRYDVWENLSGGYTVFRAGDTRPVKAQVAA